jgi:site-specific DNA-methyltransferase (adenine-specific)
VSDAWKNKLFFGDNLDILRQHISTESVDLIYLDPPFNSAANYNVLFREQSGEESAAQITAFEDTWHWTQETEYAFRDLTQSSPPRLVGLMESIRASLGENDMMAYLTVMGLRLTELHRVLKLTGSLYLHCDATASHYLKVILDSIFGGRNFINEVIWKRSGAHSDRAQGSKHFGRLHDTLLVYAKSPDYVWNQLYEKHSEDYLAAHYKYVEPETGRKYDLTDITGPGGAAKGNPYYEVMGVTRYWRYSKERMQELIEAGRIIQPKPGAVPRYKRYLDEMAGKPVQDIWDDISPINSQAKERLGYPTQKPEALLERVIKTSSNEGDIVLDPFCGCGTTVNVAERLHRRWMGIDITHLAIGLIRNRLRDTFGDELSPFEVIGEPKDVASAEALANSGLDGRYQFQWWAVGLAGGRPAQDKKKGKDTGIDGFAFFYDDSSDKAKKIIFQVKSGNVKSGDIRDLKGVLEREKAAIGVFITLKPPTKDMVKEAISAGIYESPFLPGGKCPKLQILTVEELLNGANRLIYPEQGRATFKRAERKSKGAQPEQKSFLS